MRIYLDRPVTLLTAQAEAGASAPFNTKDYQHVVIEVVTAGFTGTYKFAGSINKDAVAFATAASASNPHDYVAAYDLNDTTANLDGDTGVSETTNTSVKLYKIDVSLLSQVGIHVTARSAGSLSARLIAASE